MGTQESSRERDGVASERGFQTPCCTSRGMWGHSGLVSGSCLSNLKGKRLAEAACGSDVKSEVKGSERSYISQRAACRDKGMDRKDSL